MKAYTLTRDERRALLQRDTRAMDQQIVWRGCDSQYVGRLQRLYGLPGDLKEIAIATFGDALTVTINGRSGGLCLIFGPGNRPGEMSVDSTFISNGLPPPLLSLDVAVKPVVDATQEFFRRVVSDGGVQ
jgi:hypothetical protein